MHPKKQVKRRDEKDCYAKQKTQPAQIENLRLQEAARKDVVRAEDFIAVLTLLREEPKEGHAGLGDSHRHQKCLKHDVKVEHVVVPDSNAVVDPRAVMVKSLHAVPTDGTVPAAARADRITVWAELRALNLFKHVHEVYIIILEVSWLGAGRTGEE